MGDEYSKELCDERHSTLGRQRMEDRAWIKEQFEATRELIREQAVDRKAWLKLLPWIVAALLAGGGGGAVLTGIPDATPAPVVQGQP